MRNSCLFALALSAVFTLPVARAADKLAPDAFVGNYDLVAVRQGMLCDEHMQGLKSGSLDKNDDSYVQIDLGAFTFLGVNNGPQKFEDEQTVETSEAVTTADSMVYRGKEVSKVDGEVITTVTTAKLVGTRLTVNSKSVYKRGPGEGFTTEFGCVYRKVNSGK
ncbi:MAG: hypothetical protein ACXWR1_14915 [Bdellovibrionota bacterium]